MQSKRGRRSLTSRLQSFVQVRRGVKYFLHQERTHYSLRIRYLGLSTKKTGAVLQEVRDHSALPIEGRRLLQMMQILAALFVLLHKVKTSFLQHLEELSFLEKTGILGPILGLAPFKFDNSNNQKPIMCPTVQLVWALALVLLLAWVAAGGLRSGATGSLACYWPLSCTLNSPPAYPPACLPTFQPALIQYCFVAIGHWPLAAWPAGLFSPYNSAGLPSAYPACLLCPTILCDGLLKGLLMWTITAWPSDPTGDYLEFCVVLYEHCRSCTLLPKNLLTFDVTLSAFSWHGRDWKIINVSHVPI